MSPASANTSRDNLSMKLTDPNEYKNYNPIGDKVLLVMPIIEPTKLENVGGILIDHAAHLKSSPMRETVVVSAGPECKQVKAGDVVLWNMGNANPFPFGDNNLYFLPEQHLVCITKQAEPRCVTEADIQEALRPKQCACD